MVNMIRYGPNLPVGTASVTPDTTRGPSDYLWGDCPVDTFIQDPKQGFYKYEEFDLVGNATMSSAYAGSAGAWSIYGAAGAQINDAQIEGGGIKFGSDGDNEGVTLLSSSGSMRFITTSTLAYNQKMWFECRVARSSVATAKGDFFVGLMAPTLASGLPAANQPITTTDDTLMTAGDFFGFHSTASTAVRGGPTEWAVAFELASGTINYPTNLTTLIASTGNTALTAGDYVKLGWIFDPAPRFGKKNATSATARQTAGVAYQPVIRFFVNGIEAPAFLASVDVKNATATQAFPTSFMAPVLAVMNATGSTPPTFNPDWVRWAQAANS